VDIQISGALYTIFDKSITDITHAIELEPESYSIITVSARKPYRRMGQPEAALTDLTKAIQDGEPDASDFVSRAVVISVLNDQGGCQPGSGKALSFECKSPSDHYYYAIALVLKRAHPEALAKLILPSPIYIVALSPSPTTSSTPSATCPSSKPCWKNISNPTCLLPLSSACSPPHPRQGDDLRQQVVVLNQGQPAEGSFQTDPSAFTVIPGSPFAYWYRKKFAICSSHNPASSKMDA